MGKRYYCEHCDKYMINNRHTIKEHNKSNGHLRLKYEHYNRCDANVIKTTKYHYGVIEKQIEKVNEKKPEILFDNTMPAELLMYKQLPPSLKPPEIYYEFNKVDWG